jgi:hypothetical protein
MEKVGYGGDSRTSHPMAYRFIKTSIAEGRTDNRHVWGPAQGAANPQGVGPGRVRPPGTDMRTPICPQLATVTI